MVTGQDTQDAAIAPQPRAAAADDGAEVDDALMMAFRGGDAASFDRLYARHRGVLYRFFLRQLPRPDAEECYQEVWLKLIHGAARFEPRGEFRAYLFTIAHRVLTDRHRRTMKHAVTDPDADVDAIAQPGGGPEAAAMDGEGIERLGACIARLPIAQREALLLKAVAGLALTEIARITETSEEGVKSRVRYALQKLKRAMAES